jgi:hypothetical protein
MIILKSVNCPEWAYKGLRTRKYIHNTVIKCEKICWQSSSGIANFDLETIIFDQNFTNQIKIKWLVLARFIHSSDCQ